MLGTGDDRDRVRPKDKPVRNVASCIFQKHQDILLKHFQSSQTDLAFELCAKGLIPIATRDHVTQTTGIASVEKAGILLIDVGRVINTHSNGKKPFKKFCAVIKAHRHMKSVAAKLLKAFSKQCTSCGGDGRNETSSSTNSSSEEQVSPQKSSNFGQTIGNQGLPTDVLCSCKKKAVLHTVRNKKSANKGRLFYGCPKWDRPDSCDFFQWADQPSIQPGSSFEGSQANTARRPFRKKKRNRCTRYKSPNLKRKPSYYFERTNKQTTSNDWPQSTMKLTCECGRPAVMRMARTEKNYWEIFLWVSQTTRKAVYLL